MLEQKSKGEFTTKLHKLCGKVKPTYTITDYSIQGEPTSMWEATVVVRNITKKAQGGNKKTAKENVSEVMYNFLTEQP